MFSLNLTLPDRGDIEFYRIHFHDYFFASKLVVFQDMQNTYGMELAFSGVFEACILHAKHILITLVHHL